MFLLFCLLFPEARDCCPLGLVSLGKKELILFSAFKLYHFMTVKKQFLKEISNGFKSVEQMRLIFSREHANLYVTMSVCRKNTTKMLLVIVR